MKRSANLKRDLCAAVAAGILAGLIAAFLYTVIAGAAPVDTGPFDTNQDAYRWALKWSRQLQKNMRHAKTHARCLGERLPAKLRASIGCPFELDGDQDYSRVDWYAWGRQCRRKAKLAAQYIRSSWRRIRNPRGTRVERWLPLCWHEGWPRSQRATIVRVIYRESRGDPNVIGSGGYYGLFQMSWSFSRGRFELRNPVVNVKLALQLYKRRGWQPWPTAR